jgi:hypothetical protein
VRLSSSLAYSQHNSICGDRNFHTKGLSVGAVIYQEAQLVSKRGIKTAGA